jgi:hypothetical protein
MRDSRSVIAQAFQKTDFNSFANEVHFIKELKVIRVGKVGDCFVDYEVIGLSGTHFGAPTITYKIILMSSSQSILSTTSERFFSLCAADIGIAGVIDEEPEHEFLSAKVSEIIGKRIESIKSATGNSVIDKSLDFLQELSDTKDILSEYDSSIRHLRQKRI